VLTQIELAYLAGFFDGEGYVSISRQYRVRTQHQPRMSVTQVRPAVLHKFEIAFGGVVRHRPKLGKSGAWEWYACGMKTCIPALTLLEPFLIVKKAEAQVVIAAFQQRVKVTKLGTPPEMVALREAARIRVMGMRSSAPQAAAA